MSPFVATPPMVTGKIALEIERFRSIGEGPIGHAMVLTNPTETVKQPSPDVIRVDNGGAKLEFTIAPSGFRAVGITFKHASSAAPVPVDGPGSPFKNMKLRGDRLEIDDIFAPGLSGQSPSPQRYKFSVLVQRTSDNVVGIIDPEVENEN